MKSKKRRASIIIWTILVAGVRALYVFLHWNMVTDYYGYYEHAMIRAEESMPVLSSGLALAYTDILSKLLALCGNHPEAVLVLQGVLQVAALYFFLRAMCCLYGETAAFFSATILAAIPSILIAVGNAEPVSFYLFHFGLVFLMIGCFYILSKEKGWQRSCICGLYLILMGGYLGVVCVWNYAGFFLVILLVGVLIRTHASTKKLIRKQDQELWEDQNQVMPTFLQTLLVILGMLLGTFVMLMKYTGISGETISGQVRWWIGLLKDLPGTCQGLEFKYVIYIVVVILLGMLCNAGQTCYQKRREESRASEQKMQKQEQKEKHRIEEQQKDICDHPTLETENSGKRKNPEKTEKESTSEDVEIPKRPEYTEAVEKSTAALEEWRFDLDDDSEENWRFPDELAGEEKQQEKPDFFTAPDGRKVKYLENPLPGPKKHVSRHLDFDFEVNMDDMLAFDREPDEIEEWERKDC